MTDLDARYSLNILISELKTRGDHDGADKVADLGVKLGFWHRKDQRPLHFWPELEAKPIHTASDIETARYFEEHFDEINAELKSTLHLFIDESPPVDEPLLREGDWRMIVFFEDGARNDNICSRFPRIAKIIDCAPEEVRQAGVVMLSCLAPGSHIVPHCGLTNARLKLHLPLRTSDNAHLRVSNKTVEWHIGKSLVFDDSFEHEVWHNGHEMRVVLLVDIFHPQFDCVQRKNYIEAFNSLPSTKLRKILNKLSIEALSLAEDGEMRVRFSPELQRRLRRFLLDSNAQEFKEK